jgi:hypothetical protein
MYCTPQNYSKELQFKYKKTIVRCLSPNKRYIKIMKLPCWNVKMRCKGSYLGYYTLEVTLYIWNKYNQRKTVSYPEGRTQIEGVWEQGAEENIWKRKDVIEGWQKLYNELNCCNFHQVLLQWVKHGRWDGWGMKNAWEMNRKFSFKTWREEPLGRPSQRWEDNIKMDLKYGGLTWFRLRTNGRLSNEQKHL